MSNTARNVNPSSPSTGISEQAILAHPAADWTVIDGRGLRGDVDYETTTLLATINGEEVRLVETNYDNSYGTAGRPDQIGSTGYHHWNSKHKLFDQVARGIESNLADRADRAANEALALIGGSDPLMWEKGPKVDYRGGQFLFGGYRRSFDNYSAFVDNPQADRCAEGYLGRIGHTSILVREMKDGSVRGEISVAQGDLHKTVELSDTETRKALALLRPFKIG